MRQLIDYINFLNKRKMKNNSLISSTLFFVVILFATFFLISCEKENPSSEPNNSEVYESGILEFQDNQELHNTIEIVKAMSNDEYQSWQSSQNFVSLRTKLDNVYRQFNDEENVNNEELVYKVIADNSKWVELVTDEYGEKCVYPRVQDKDYSSVLNIDGVCIVGEKALKIIGDYKVLAPKSQLMKLVDTDVLANAKENENWEVIQYKFTISSFLKSTNEYELQASTTYKGSSCGKARRCFIQMVLIQDDYGTTNKVSLRTRLTSERKYACVWVHYWTSMSAKNVSCSARCWSGSQGQWFSGIIAPFSMQSDGDDWSTQTTKELFSFTNTYPVNNTPEFISAHGEATSRGVNGQWAIINYNK
jgi:hypothetical protein